MSLPLGDNFLDGDGRLDSLAKKSLFFVNMYFFCLSFVVVFFFLVVGGGRSIKIKDRCTGTYGFTLHQYLECGLTR